MSLYYIDYYAVQDVNLCVDGLYYIDYYAAQDVNLCVDELEEWSFYSDYLINKNLKYHPNCTIDLHEAIKSVGFILYD